MTTIVSLFLFSVGGYCVADSCVKHFYRKEVPIQVLSAAKIEASFNRMDESLDDIIRIIKEQHKGIDKVMEALGSKTKDVK